MNIFLLRGLIRESRHWSNFPKVLQDALPGCNVICLEPDGVGQKNNRNSPASIKAIMETIRPDYLEKKGEQNMLISISLGGMIASQWVKNYPDDFDKIVIMNSSFKNLSPIWKRLQLQSLFTFLKVALTKDIEVKERTIVNMVCNNVERREDVWQEWVKIAKDRPVSAGNGLKQLAAAATYSVSENRPKADCLILAGKGDRLAHWSCSEKLSKQWEAPVSYHPWAGHSLTEDVPEWVAAQVKSFI